MGYPNDVKVGDAGHVADHQKIRDDIKALQAIAGGGMPGIVQIDSFPGADDTAKLNAALAYAAAQSRIPWLQFPARIFDTGSANFAVFTGMKLLGPGFPFGPQNLEILGGKGVAGWWRTSCGNGAASLLQATSTVYDWKVVGVAFWGSSTSSQIFRSTQNAYAVGFANLTFYNCKHAFGNPTEKFLTTQAVFDGHFTHLSFADTQDVIGGSDCQFTWYVNADSPTSVAGAGRPIIILDAFGKMDHNGYLYLTAENDWGGLQIKGNDTHKLSFFGGTFEGRSQTNLATRPVVDVQGGHVVMYSPHVGQVSDTASALGAITQSGGVIEMYSPHYWRGSGVNPAFPLLYQSGGTAKVLYPKAGVAGEQIRLRWSDGSVVTVPLPSNGFVA